MDRILIIDTSYLIYRSYFAYPRLSYNGMPTGAFYGFVKAVMQMYDELQPSSVLFAIDLPEKTWRHDEYDGYKATRSPADAAMVEQIPLILEWARSITPNVFGVSKFEADDVIGSVCRQYLLNSGVEIEAKKEQLEKSGLEGFAQGQTPDLGKEALVFSSDKDLYQLFTVPGVTFVKSKPKGGGYDLFGLNEFLDKHGLQADQWVDAKALIGDNSDNLPGLPGVGPKTAQTMLTDFGYLYYIYDVLGMDPSPFRRPVGSEDYKQKAVNWAANPKKEKHIKLLQDNYDQVVRIYNLSTLSDVGGVSVEYSKPQFGNGLGMMEKYAFKSLIQQTNRYIAKDAEPDALF